MGFLLNIPYYFAKVMLLPSVSGGNLFFSNVLLKFRSKMNDRRRVTKESCFFNKKYVRESQQEAFYDDISKPDVPVKGILADFNKVKTRTVDEADGNLIRDIYFYFC